MVLNVMNAQKIVGNVQTIKLAKVVTFIHIKHKMDHVNARCQIVNTVHNLQATLVLDVNKDTV